MRIELTPSAWKAEVLPLNYIRKIGAEDEIRTRDPRLGKAMLYPWATSAYILVEGGGFEPPKAQLTDLQSAPFGHSGIPRYCLFYHCFMNYLCISIGTHESMNDSLRQRRVSQRVHYTIILINVQRFFQHCSNLFGFDSSVLSVELAEGITHMLRICRSAPSLSVGLNISRLESPPDFLPALEPFRVRFLRFVSGAGGGNRTPNLLITNQLLYRWATPA